MAYKSARLLVEAVHKQIDEQRQMLMSIGDDIPFVAVNSDLQEGLNDLRKLFDELAAMADRPTIDDVLKLKPVDYVTTMKPLVRIFHQQLMSVDKLAQALCEDLQANACVLFVMGDEKTVVRAAHDSNRPEVALAVEALLASLDSGTKQIVEEGAKEAADQLGITDEYAARVEPEDEQPLRVKYHDAIIEEDRERNDKAVFVVDMYDVVVKDFENGNVGRLATLEELEGCTSVKDPGRDDI